MELVVWNRQEGHTAHATKEEATEMVEAALDLYASACAKHVAKRSYLVGLEDSWIEKWPIQD